MKVNSVLSCSSPKCATPAKNSTSMNNSQPLRKECCGDSVQFTGNKAQQASDLVFGVVPEGMSYRDLVKMIQGGAKEVGKTISKAT